MIKKNYNIILQKLNQFLINFKKYSWFDSFINNIMGFHYFIVLFKNYFFKYTGKGNYIYLVDFFIIEDKHIKMLIKKIRWFLNTLTAIDDNTYILEQDNENEEEDEYKVKLNYFFYNLFYFWNKNLFAPIQFLLFKFVKFLIYIENNYLSIYIKKDYLLFFIKYLKLKNIFFFKILTDLTVIDYIGFSWKKRFKVVYNLFSLKFNYRLFINTFLNIKEGLNSLYFLFFNSNWLEREIWDMFGIVFFNHPDFRRILTDYGFRWYPLRKDFPVSGYIELWYDETIQDITYKPIKLMQEMRFYMFVSTWENLI